MVKYCRTCGKELISAQTPAYDSRTGQPNPTKFLECPEWDYVEGYNRVYVNPLPTHDRYQLLEVGRSRSLQWVLISDVH